MHMRADAYSEPQLENPLRDLTRPDLEEQARSFYQHYELDSVVDEATLVRGALIAQDKKYIVELPAFEQAVINDEKKLTLRKQPKGVLITILVTAFAAIIQGWQQSTINSSSLGWQCEPIIKERLSRLHSLAAPATDAAPWLSGSIIGTLISDPLQGTKHGRRPALFISALFCFAGALGSAYSTQWAHLLACRLVLGIGIGAKASISPVFAAEAAPDHLRGQMLMMWQLFDTCGICLGFVFYWIAKRSWRLILGSAAIPAIVLMIITFLSPESPRFLIGQREYVKAFRSLQQLRGTPIQAARDLYRINSLLEREARVLGFPRRVDTSSPIADQVAAAFGGFFDRVQGLWMIHRNRRACVAAFLVMLTQQLCGINVLAFYSSTLFRTEQEVEKHCANNPMGDSRVAQLNVGFGLANLVFTFPAYFVIDRRGRRKLLLISITGMLGTLAIVSGAFSIPHEKETTRVALIATFAVVVFNIFYGLGAGPVPFTFSAELFPLQFREVGMSFSVLVNFLGLGLLVFFVPSLTKALSPNHREDGKGHTFLLVLFTGLDALALVLVYLLMPGDTEKKPLEEMNAIFNTPIRQHAQRKITRFMRKKKDHSNSGRFVTDNLLLEVMPREGE